MARISNETPYHKGAARDMSMHRPMITAPALLLIGVAVVGAGMGTRARSAPPEPDRPDFDVPADKQYRVTLAGGASFEVVAISNHYPSGPKTWWRPDGTTLPEAPADPSQRVPFGKTGEVLLDILVRVSELPTDSTLKWVPTYDHSCLTYGDRGVTKGGRLVPELRACIISVRPDRTTGSMRIQFAAGPWKTECSDGGRAFNGGIPIIKDGHKFYFGKARPYQYNGGTTLAVAHNLTDVDLHTRVVHVDGQGKEHPADN